MPPGVRGLLLGADFAEAYQGVKEVSLAADCLCSGEADVDRQKGQGHGKDAVAESGEGSTLHPATRSQMLFMV